MSKIIVAKDQIVTDSALIIIKAFRILNKRCGELKTKFQEENDDEARIEYETCISKMKKLSEKATAEYNFQIWVGFDGKTGHTYPKDYKITGDDVNDFEAYKIELRNQSAVVENLINSISMN